MKKTVYPQKLSMKKICPSCGNWKWHRAELCQKCRYAYQRKTITPHQRLILLAFTHFDGDAKAVSRVMNLGLKGVEYHLIRLLTKLKVRTYYGLINWAWRNGLVYSLIFFCLAASARPWWKHNPPPPPPPTPATVTTNAFFWWPAVPGATTYRLSIPATGQGGLTLGTNFVQSGLTNGAAYSASVQAAGATGLWSTNSCAVSFVAGSGLTDACPASLLSIADPSGRPIVTSQ